MVIPVNPVKSDLYKAYISCLNPLLKLKTREMEVLDIMTKTYFSLYTAVQKGQVPANEIYERMHGGAGRKIMRDAIKMSRASFNNHLSQLKRKKVVTEQGELPKFLTEIYKQKEPIKIQYIIETQK
jgi:DNA-binding transcriptional ArsR family regulator